MAEPTLKGTEIAAKYLAFTPEVTLAPQTVGQAPTGDPIEVRGETLVNVILAHGAPSSGASYEPAVQKSRGGRGAWRDASGDVASGSLEPITAEDGGGVRSLSLHVDPEYPFVRLALNSADDGATMNACALIVKGATAASLKPYMLRQLQDSINRLAWARGSGEPPTNEPTIGEILNA